ncbi:multiple RNA-binding protein domain-containing protein 1 [Angomonas deanei]|nr:multiple RNA-binding protein domain-containing protein 1 [Angomonas deanei]|eukprot:EPY32628.1 multiple RNA-binding protein domain-containing protein 1 [Angomonas deanei]
MDTRQSKGKAFLLFYNPENAVKCLSYCRGAIFMGRLLHCMAASEDPYANLNHQNNSVAGNSKFKQEKHEKEVSNQNNNNLKWNTLYMNSATAVASVAQRLNLKSENIINIDQKGSAVRAAVAEAFLGNEVKSILDEEHVNISVLENTLQHNVLLPRSNHTILVKNLNLLQPHKNNKKDDEALALQLSKLFLKYGPIESCVFPSSGLFALFHYENSQDARVAFTRLSFKLFNDQPLYLEWAPVGAIMDDKDNNNNNTEEVQEQENKNSELQRKTKVYTLFVNNISFQTSEDDFYTFLVDQCPRLAKHNNNNENEEKNKLLLHFKFMGQQGQAFLTLRDETTLQYVQQKLNKKKLANRILNVEIAKDSVNISNQTIPPEEEEDAMYHKGAAEHQNKNSENNNNNNNNVPAGCDPYKIIVKNLPFEAVEKDVRELFSAFSEIKSVRVPQKKSYNNLQHNIQRNNNHRGFAFVEFLSAGEAQSAMKALRHTHLYGRHLVLEYAKLEE